MKAPLLAGIKRYFDICEEEKELAAAASDQTRLLGRGSRDPGRLLREEKMRKRVSKEKPRVRAFSAISFCMYANNKLLLARTRPPYEHPRLGTRGRPPVLGARPEHPAHPHADCQRRRPGECRRDQRQRQAQALARWFRRACHERPRARDNANTAELVRAAHGHGRRYARRAPSAREQSLTTEQAREDRHDAELRV